jgi:hypothetical protein
VVDVVVWPCLRIVNNLSVRDEQVAVLQVVAAIAMREYRICLHMVHKSMMVERDTNR